MATKLIYQILVKLLSWIVLRARSDTTKEIEILVLRHQLAALQRRTPRPRISWSDLFRLRRHSRGRRDGLRADQVSTRRVS
jgi:hypothetical protein